MSILRIGLLDLVILQNNAFLKQNKFIPVSSISFYSPFLGKFGFASGRRFFTITKFKKFEIAHFERKKSRK